MYCTKCGEKLNEGVLFCHMCGTKTEVNHAEELMKEPAAVLTEMKSATTADDTPVQKETQNTNVQDAFIQETSSLIEAKITKGEKHKNKGGKKKEKSRKTKIISIVAVVLIVIGACAGYLYMVDEGVIINPGVYAILHFDYKRGYYYGPAFNRKKITECNVPDKYIGIGDQAFKGCENLRKVSFGKNVKEIGGQAFSGCSNLEKINLSKVRIIRSYAFEECSELEEVDLSNIEEVGFNAFAGCSRLTNVIFDQSRRVKSCDTFMLFSGCDNLKTISLPQGVKTIGYSTFYNCSGLESIYIPDSVENIEYQAFEGCTSLRTIYIPDSVEKIEKGAFRGCKKLEVICVSQATYEKIRTVGIIGYNDFVSYLTGDSLNSGNIRLEVY